MLGYDRHTGTYICQLKKQTKDKEMYREAEQEQRSKYLEANTPK